MIGADLGSTPAEAESVGYGFDLPKIVVAPNAPKNPSVKSEAEVAA
jgi:hypothetical protein